MDSVEEPQPLIWGWKRCLGLSGLPCGFDHSVFRDSLEVVEMTFSRGATPFPGTVGICAGGCFPAYSVTDAPVLCRFDGGFARSAFRKVCVPHVFSGASRVRAMELCDPFAPLVSLTFWRPPLLWGKF